MNTVESSLNAIANNFSSSWTLKDLVQLIISLMATAVAIYVPLRIMKKQNQIALFDKCFNIYQQAKEIVDFASVANNFKGLPNNPNPSDIEFAQAIFSFWCSKNYKTNIAFGNFQKDPENGALLIYLINVSLEILQAQITTLDSSKYLFHAGIANCLIELSEKYEKFVHILIDAILNMDIESYEIKKNALAMCTDRFKKIENDFKRYLKISHSF